MRYPVTIEPGNNSTAWGVIVPDLPGCFSAGDALEEAMIQAEDAIMDLRLSEALGTTPGYWLALQDPRDLWTVRQGAKDRKRIAAIELETA